MLHYFIPNTTLCSALALAEREIRRIGFLSRHNSTTTRSHWAFWHCLIAWVAVGIAQPNTLAAYDGAAAVTYTIEWSSNCRSAYQSIMSLQLDKGKHLLQTEQGQNPNNLLPLLLENYIDLLVLFISEDAALLQQLEPNKSKRLTKLAQLPAHSPYRRYAQAEINLQWAAARLKFEQYFSAFRETQKAHQLLVDNQTHFPNFYPNLKSLGLIHALVGTVPTKYKWGVSLLGLSGNLNQGMAELDDFTRQSDTDPAHLFREEGALLQIFLTAYLKNQPQRAWQLAARLPTEKNLLHNFVAADMALRAGNNDQAIDILLHRPTTAAGFYDFPYLDFLLGACKLNRADIDANAYFQRFLNRFKGKNYVKDAFQRLAWYSLLQNEPEGYQLYMELCRSKGATLIDADKQALKNAQSGKIPHYQLLKARLLFDGGYCSQAIAAMDIININTLKNTEQRLEYQYRYGRIAECMRQTEQAIAHYKKVISADANTATAYYFAPKSCLQLGGIYEQQADYATARRYYEQCLSYKSHDYKNSFEQQAKAGLGRLAKK